MIAIDTNIWIYSHDSRDPAKQSTAISLIATARPMSLPWQVGCEFVAASRKLGPAGFSAEDAWKALEAMQVMAHSVVLPIPDDWSQASILMQTHSLSLWDALLLACCLRAQVTTLYSEDMAHGTRIEGMTIVNPFLT
ncbi:MAG TPA: PIN domain-containing protein [Pirellulales bacterium]|nr:PIN domain-containing protein [Pirellulales bacterium]